MSILKVARMGHPVLREKARELSVKETQSPRIKRLIRDMVDTMHEYSGIGLAAPQVHESIQLAVLEFEDENERYPDMGKQPLLVLFNPKIKVLDEAKQGYWEGCLSIPEIRGLVHRPRKIRVDYTDEKGKPRKIEAEGFLATVFQHELDHLAGTLFIDRIQDTTKLAFIEEYQRYWLPEKDAEVGELGD